MNKINNGQNNNLIYEKLYKIDWNNFKLISNTVDLSSCGQVHGPPQAQVERLDPGHQVCLHQG